MICKDFLVLLSFKLVAQPLRSTPQPSYPTLGRALHLHIVIDDAVMTNRTENLVAYPIQSSLLRARPAAVKLKVRPPTASFSFGLLLNQAYQFLDIEWQPMIRLRVASRSSARFPKP
jgi:hypothetical protein